MTIFCYGYVVLDPDRVAKLRGQRLHGYRGGGVLGGRRISIRFGAGSWPEAARGLNRFELIHEVTLEKRAGETEECAYFAFMTEGQCISLVVRRWTSQPYPPVKIPEDLKTVLGSSFTMRATEFESSRSLAIRPRLLTP